MKRRVRASLDFNDYTDPKSEMKKVKDLIEKELDSTEIDDFIIEGNNFLTIDIRASTTEDGDHMFDYIKSLFSSKTKMNGKVHVHDCTLDGKCTNPVDKIFSGGLRRAW